MITYHFLLFLTPLSERLEFANYPGLELWKFLNLAIFVTVGYVILRKPISGALAARGETIKRELEKAKAESEAASHKLAEAESLLAHAEDDVKEIQTNVEHEAEAERQRQAFAGEAEIQRLKAQAQRELEQARKVVHKDLQDFLASRSLEIAKQSVRNELRPEDDLRLIKERIGELRRARG
jgi:F0F1-type ATP synthase membrane subunit b/b'